MKEDLKALIGTDERIMYEGRPSRKCYIFESIFNPLMPFAIIWALFDFSFIGLSIFSQSADKSFLLFIIPFFAIHLMPVWLYLGGVLLASKRHKNTYYIVTDRAVYISSGIIHKSYTQKPFAEMSHVELHRGFFDQKFNVGDIILTSSQRSVEGVTSSARIDSIDNYVSVYNMIKKLQQDIYTDIMYPNDKRPKENHGYNTEYKGE